MKVTIRKLYEEVKDTNITLLAGKEGLSRTVSWVHFVESNEISEFLEGGEVVFVTGVAIEKDDDLFPLIESIIRNGASGIVINVGLYIKEVPSEILEICEERQIPLLVVPWSVYMAEIMRRFCLTITLAGKKELEMIAAVKNAIFFPSQRELYVPHLESYGLDLNVSYIVLLISMESEEISNKDITRKMLIRQIENYAYRMNWPCVTLEIDNEVILLFTDTSDDEVSNCLEQLKENCTSFQVNRNIFSGIGQSTKNMYCISKSFAQAKTVINLQKRYSSSINNNRYGELGIYKILLKVKEKEVIEDFIEETIGGILKYDEINNSNLEEVLRVYLKNNGSVKETADILFVHRNTINYKISKINNMLNINLAYYEDCSKVIIALKLYDIAKMDKAHN